jgi:hypothetical protein
MSFGWFLTIGIVAAFAVAIGVESVRVPRLETWCRLRGFARVDSQSSQDIAPFVSALGQFHDGRAERWGFAMAGQAGRLPVGLAEVDWRFGPKSRYWYTIAMLTVAGADLPEMMIENSSRALDRLARVVSLPLAPLEYLASRVRRPERQAQKVTFPEDQAFERAFDVYGSDEAVRRFLSPEVRQALVSCEWRGRLVTSGVRLAWRRPGMLWPTRADRMLANLDLFVRMAQRP